MVHKTNANVMSANEKMADTNKKINAKIQRNTK